MRATTTAAPIALVTGAGAGIGEAVATALALAGSHVVVTDSDIHHARALAADLRANDLTATAHWLDVTDSAAVDDAVDLVEAQIGPIHTLVNVAGVLHIGEVVELEEQVWVAPFAVNTHGVFHTSRAVARRMLPRRAGAIVTVSSAAAGVPRVKMAAHPAASSTGEIR